MSERKKVQIQNNLFHELGEWEGMPEFIQEKKEPYSKIIIRFETKEDLEDFAKIINQKLTNKTKSIWHPYKSHFNSVQKKWVDES